MNHRTVTARVACVAIVACLIVPLAQMLFPTAASEIGALSFNAIEAVVTTTLGFALYTVLFG
jgi:hypothetical protein